MLRQSSGRLDRPLDGAGHESEPWRIAVVDIYTLHIYDIPYYSRELRDTRGEPYYSVPYMDVIEQQRHNFCATVPNYWLILVRMDEALIGQFGLELFDIVTHDNVISQRQYFHPKWEFLSHSVVYEYRDFQSQLECADNTRFVGLHEAHHRLGLGRQSLFLGYLASVPSVAFPEKGFLYIVCDCPWYAHVQI